MAKAAIKTADTVSTAMDYAQHEGTYKAFMGFTKWTLIALALLVVSLYCFIQAQQPILGAVLLLIDLAVVFYVVVLKPKSA